jgi:probable sodium:solute symporter
MSVQTWTFLIVGGTFALYIGIAIWSRANTTGDFYIAGRGVHPVVNGMATGADWMSAASFISMAGLISFMGYDGAVYLMGWTGGYVLLALLLAPYLRKFGKFTVPDFVGDRYYSNGARIVAVVCAVFVSFTYVAGQMRGVGVVFSRFLEVDINVGVGIGMAIVFFYAVLGGMKGITYTQAAQYCVLIFAYLVPAIFISILLTDKYIPAQPAEHGAGLCRVHIGQEIHAGRLVHHRGAHGGNRRAAPRHRAFLHGAEGARCAYQRRLGALLHRPPLHHRSRGGCLRTHQPHRHGERRQLRGGRG